MGSLWAGIAPRGLTGHQDGGAWLASLERHQAHLGVASGCLLEQDLEPTRYWSLIRVCFSGVLFEQSLSDVGLSNQH